MNLTLSILPALPLLPGIGMRLKEQRQKIGATQHDLAQIGEVSRPTQAHYEAERTAPDTEYLAKIQKTGIDVPFLLFSKSANSISTRNEDGGVNWQLMQRAWDEVEFFCLKVAPSCPVSYRWRMVAELYEALVSRTVAPTHEDLAVDAKPLVHAIWDRYGK